MTKSHDIVPTHLAIQAIRDNGYKNTTYAIAELVDNSIQAGATEVKLLCGEREEYGNQRSRKRIHQIGVLDNGSGMSTDVLRIALQFGNGIYLKPEKRTGMGRFGMGLPSSSISQCEKVEVWTWQNGIEDSIYSYLDLKEIISGELKEVPEPQKRSIPELWLKVGKDFGKSGTLVVWSRLDRLIWKTARAIIEHSKMLIGRMYRYFIEKKKVNIYLIPFNSDNPEFLIPDTKAKPNDPIYLMTDTSCPKPFHDTPMFDPWGGENFEVNFNIEFRDKEHEVKIRFTHAKEEARKGHNPGAKPHGKHAAKNVGVSILRAGRELDLDQTWSDPSNPRDRWWGVEIEFPPALDDLFGVTNNKQSARNFTEMAKTSIESLMNEYDKTTITTLKEEMEKNDDPRAPLINIAHRIQKNINIIRALLVGQKKGERSSKRPIEKTSPEKIATEATTERKEEGHQGISDVDEYLPPETRKEEIRATLLQDGVTNDVANEISANTVDDGLKYRFIPVDLENSAFFSVALKGGAIIIKLNINHPVYSHLVEILESDKQDSDKQEDKDPNILASRLEKARDGLKLLLAAWARYEDEQPDGKARERAQDTRVDWGRIARDFFDYED